MSWNGGVAGLLLGLILGSFCATLILRWPEGRSVRSGRSRCDGCGAVLTVGELVPLWSYAVRRGRCGRCGGRIDPLHPAVELGCAALGLASGLFAPWPAALGWMAVGWALLTLALLDARHFWLPDAITLPLAVLGLALAPLVTGTGRLDGLIGAAGGAGLLWGIARLYRLTRGRDGLGMGDAKLLAALGAWGGWQALPAILLLASLAGLAWAGAIALRGGKVDGATRLPLGTLLCVAALPGWWLAGLLGAR